MIWNVASIINLHSAPTLVSTTLCVFIARIKYLLGLMEAGGISQVGTTTTAFFSVELAFWFTVLLHNQTISLGTLHVPKWWDSNFPRLKSQKRDHSEEYFFTDFCNLTHWSCAFQGPAIWYTKTDVPPLARRRLRTLAGDSDGKRIRKLFSGNEKIRWKWGTQDGKREFPS